MKQVYLVAGLRSSRSRGSPLAYAQHGGNLPSSLPSSDDIGVIDAGDDVIGALLHFLDVRRVPLTLIGCAAHRCSNNAQIQQSDEVCFRYLLTI